MVAFDRASQSTKQSPREPFVVGVAAIMRAKHPSPSKPNTHTRAVDVSRLTYAMKRQTAPSGPSRAYTLFPCRVGEPETVARGFLDLVEQRPHVKEVLHGDHLPYPSKI